eukprot:gene3032-5042_t
MSKLRNLKYHEQKLLKKVDFLSWETDGNQEYRARIIKAISKYRLRDQEEFFKYQKIATEVNEAIKSIKGLPDTEEYKEFKKSELSKISLKLYQMGILREPNHPLDKKLLPEQFCNRRISYLMFKQHYAESVTLAANYISHGHIRIGPEIITDPAYLVTRNLEDFITWSEGSNIKKSILKFNDEYDDYNQY